MPRRALPSQRTPAGTFQVRVQLQVVCLATVISVPVCVYSCRPCTGFSVPPVLLQPANGADKAIVVLQCDIEDLVLPEKVDVIITSSFGYALVNGRGVEWFTIARDKFLKPGGKMFPSTATVYVAPFSDAVLHEEQVGSCAYVNVQHACVRCVCTCRRKRDRTEYIVLVTRGLVLTTMQCYPRTPVSSLPQLVLLIRVRSVVVVLF